MPLQILPDVFKWLQGLAIIKEGKRNSNNLIEISEQISVKMMDGFLFGAIIKSCLQGKNDEQKIKKIESLKQNSNPAVRIYNWGILSDLLKKMGFNLQYAEKSKLINLDPEPLTKILAFLQQSYTKSGNYKKQEGNSMKVDISQINKKTIKDAANALQFLIISISKNFKISPQQTLNLFLDNNKYLSHLLSKGVKNSYQPIYAFLNEIKSHIETIVNKLFSIDEQQNVNFMFNALRTCLISKDQGTAQLYVSILLDVYDQYRLSGFSLQIIRNWIKNEGINSLFFSIKKHPSLTSGIITICYEYLDDEFFKYIHLSQKNILWGTQRQKYSFYKLFIEQAKIEILDKFAITAQFQEWNRFFIKNMKKVKDNYEILLIMAIMEEQWNKLSNKFEQSDLGMPNQYINFMKQQVSSKNELLFVQSTRTMFSLMQKLGQVKNPFAPLIYKLLISVYVNLTDLQRIAFISDNLSVSFKGIQSLPGSPLVQPLLFHLQKNIDYSVINLSCTLMEENRLSNEEIYDLILMLTKIVFQNIIHGSLVLDLIFENIEKLSFETNALFLQNHLKISLAQLYSLSKAITKTLAALKDEKQKMQDQEGKNKATELFISNAQRHIICKNCVSFISKSIFHDEKLKTQSQVPIFETYVKIKVELRKKEQAQLLIPVMTSYYQDEQLQEKIEYYTNLLFPPKPVKPKVERSHSHSHTHDHMVKSMSIKTLHLEDEPEKSAVILDPSVLKPSTYAIKDLQKLKQKRYEMKTIEIERQKQKVKKQEKLEQFMTIQYEKRLVQSMSTIKNDVEYKNLQTIQDHEKPQTSDQNQNKEKDSNMQYIRLINLQKQEEDAYREDVQSIMKKYKKVWRYLFYKYSSKKIQGNEDKTHMGEAWRMLKDYDLNFFKKEEVFAIIRLINENLKRKNDIQNLTYSGFQELILQIAIVGYTKIGSGHLSPGNQLMLLVQHLRNITKDKAGSIQIFDNPEEAYFQQTEVIRQFNKRLKENPNYILPEGYKRIKQTTLEYEYDFHPMLQKNVKTSYVQVLEILDQFFFKNPKFQFHLIEPLTIKSQLYLAKPALFQSISQKIRGYSKGYLSPKKTITNQEDIKLPSPPMKKQFKPYINFSLGIKLGIAETSLKNKSIAEEVAYCMQDILNAIESNRTLKKGIKKRVINDLVRKKKIQLVKIETERKKQEINWKKRAESVKLQVQALREKRKESEKLKKKKQYEDKRLKKQKDDRSYREKIQQFEKIKAKIAQKKEALLELKAVEQQKMKKQKQSYREGVSEYFRVKKEELKEKQQSYKKRKAEQSQKKKQAQENKQQFVKRLYLQNLKKEEQVLQKIDEIKQKYEDTWQSEQIQNIMNEKKKSLKLLFELLLKYQKSKISATNYDEIGLNTLNFFCMKFQIVPFMLRKQDVNKIYTFATKQTEEKMKNKKGINQETFLEIIFLISVKAKKLLNKLSEKQKKKEKKIQAFLNAKKSPGGNHYQTKDVDQSQLQSSEESDQEKPTLQDEYLFNAEDVSEATIEQIFSFLKLPNDKLSMQERYKQALETKTSKPQSILIKQIKQSLDL